MVKKRSSILSAFDLTSTRADPRPRRRDMVGPAGVAAAGFSNRDSSPTTATARGGGGFTVAQGTAASKSGGVADSTSPMH